jgi:tripartite-type tricarboxylate transporter receptor subunit TctC
MQRRTLLLALCAALGAAAPSAALHAQAFPSKPVKWVVPWPAGGGADFVGRSVAFELEKHLGQPVIVENRPGGGGIVAAMYVAQSAPDGYTLYQADGGPLVFNVALYAKLPYDPIRDFAPVSQIGRYPLTMVAAPNVKANTAKEWFEEARRNPGKFEYASIGIGSAFHLAMELLKQQTKTDVVQLPYKGDAPAVQDVIAGRVPVMVLSTAGGLQLIRSGKLKALGSLTHERQAQLPNVPTMDEQGIPGAVVYAWQGIVVPAGTPAPIIQHLNQGLVRALAAPALREKLSAQAVEVVTSTPAELGEYIQKESAFWHPFIRERGIKVEGQ